MRLGDNQLAGNIPDFSNLPNLKDLRLDDNQLTGNIPNFSNLLDLEILNISGNQLTGNVPNFSNLPNLKYLTLFRNQLVGNIPVFSSIPNLESLSLHDNQLTGSIPDFSNLPDLDYLYLENNNLTGSIPDFSNLHSLNSLVISNNQLIGSVPDFLNLEELENLSLDSNNIEFLPSFSNLPNLEHFSCISNLLTFDDILPNINIAINTNSYAPQAMIFTPNTYNQNAGTPLTIDLGIDGNIPDNNYQWYKNGNVYGLPTNSNNLTFSSLQFSDSGVYHCEVTNPGAPDLTLVSHDIAIAVSQNSDCCQDSTAFFNRVSEGFNYYFDCDSIYVKPGGLNSCDFVTWDWGDGSPVSYSNGIEEIGHPINLPNSLNMTMLVEESWNSGASYCTEKTYSRIIPFECSHIQADLANLEDDFFCDISNAPEVTIIPPTSLMSTDIYDLDYDNNGIYEILNISGTNPFTFLIPAGQNVFPMGIRINRGACGQGCSHGFVKTIVETTEETHNNFSIYPNPTLDKVNIEFERLIPINSEFQLFDIRGSEIRDIQFDISNRRVSLDLQNVVSGIYLMKVNINDQIIFAKIIKQ